MESSQLPQMMHPALKRIAAAYLERDYVIVRADDHSATLDGPLRWLGRAAHTVFVPLPRDPSLTERIVLDVDDDGRVWRQRTVLGSTLLGRLLTRRDAVHKGPGDDATGS